MGRRGQAVSTFYTTWPQSSEVGTPPPASCRVTGYPALRPPPAGVFEGVIAYHGVPWLNDTLGQINPASQPARLSPTTLFRLDIRPMTPLIMAPRGISLTILPKLE